MARKVKERSIISDQIRQAIESSELSRYEICKQAGIDQAAMSRFMSGERGLSTSTLDKLADVLNFKIVVRKRG